MGALRAKGKNNSKPCSPFGEHFQTALRAQGKLKSCSATIRGGLADLRRDTELPLRGKPYRAGSYRLTPVTPGLRAPARRDRQPKPGALSGRRG